MAREIGWLGKPLRLLLKKTGDKTEPVLGIVTVLELDYLNIPDEKFKELLEKVDAGDDSAIVDLIKEHGAVKVMDNGINSLKTEYEDITADKRKLGGHTLKQWKILFTLLLISMCFLTLTQFVLGIRSFAEGKTFWGVYDCLVTVWDAFLCHRVWLILKRVVYREEL